jgi:isoamylase
LRKYPELLSVITGNFSFERGHPLPLGATIVRGGINFSIFSRHATSVSLVLFLSDTEEEMAEFPLDSNYNRTGDVWHAFIAGLDPGIEYGYRMDGPKEARHRFNPETLLADPCAMALNTPLVWGDESMRYQDSYRRAILLRHEYDWGFDQPINRPLADSIIYEAHVRGFTRHPSANTASPGTFRGLTEKIPYLKELGITAVELLPVTEFDECDIDRVNPEDGSRLYNFWGYHPLSFFALKAGYAASKVQDGVVSEFKDMVKAMHSAGIEVILDVVYNHSGEGNHTGPVFSFKGIDNSVYYMLDPDSRYMNFSGCGNTINCNHPYVRSLILDSLRYWVTEMHVDGFRFDLASILGRAQDGTVLASPPLLEQIAGDPVLAETKLIAEAWDAAGLYQVGNFPNWGRWAEWNGHFRDDIRRFVRGDEGMVRNLATRLAGSSDLYQNSREPAHGINFITCHDGFCLQDLVSYEKKHNLANGEDNLDGENHNLSSNCGVEGPVDDKAINALRDRQIRNLTTLLLMSRGVPMILAGDEMGRSQKGNNNAYCQDNEINWINWDLLENNKGLNRFFRLLIAFRKGHALLRHNSFVIKDGYGVKFDWHGFNLGKVDWSGKSRSLGMHMHGETPGGLSDDIFLIANSDESGHLFELPKIGCRQWKRFIDTGYDWENAITEIDGMWQLKNQEKYLVRDRSVVVLIAKN